MEIITGAPALKFWWLSVLSLLVWPCLVQSSDSLLQQCITSFDPNTNYYQKMIPADVLDQNFVLPLPIELQEVVTAKGFAVSYGNYYKIIRNQNYNLTYLLHQCGSPVPSLTSLGLPPANGTFQLPVRGPATDSTIPVAFLELLGRLENLTLTETAADFIGSSCVLKYMADGEIKTVSNTAGNTTEVIFTSASGQPTYEANAVSFDATFDGGPLKRAEWIKYMATFFNAEDRAHEVFSYVNASYQCLNMSRSGSTGTNPLVAWLSFSGVSWTISGAAYKMQFDLDAGGLNLNADVLDKIFNMSNQDEVDEFHQILRTIDAVVDETYAPDPFSYTLDNFTANARIDTPLVDYPFLTSKRVIRVDKRVGRGLDWFEMAIPQPHVVLHDLINMLYPSQAYSSTYLRNIALGEIPVNVTLEPCTRPIAEALEPKIISDPNVVKCVKAAGNLGKNGATLLSPAPLAVMLAGATFHLAMMAILL
ncbi:hypothetical protein R1flu_020156 [Riccia fluitans]|uniref:Uncharacterized protein n=1 Tax=Riccia fluitans TaxID=41844 RepID=A0ABD1ZKQ9_9MARC